MATTNTPRIEFKGQKYSVGDYTGYRPAATGSVQIVKDLAFMNEVVERNRLATSASELLHNIQMVIKTAPELVAEDGFPRGITGLVKFDRSFKGKLEAANSGWNESCHCVIKAKLYSGTTREITDAEFRNVNAATKVKVTNVIYDGATSGKNVIKGDRSIIAYGENMLFIATGDDADLATLTTADGTVRTLACTESDAGKMVFAWPAGLTVEDGAAAELYIRSHAGILGNDDSVNKKSVTCLAADPAVMSITKTSSVKGDNIYKANEGLTIYGANFQASSKVYAVFTATATGDTVQREIGTFSPNAAGTEIVIDLVESIATIDNTKPMHIVVQKAGVGSATSPDMTYTEV